VQTFLTVAAGVLGALSSALWYVPGQVDMNAATLGAGLSALVCAALTWRIIGVLRRAR
jgi:hypothetical protein